MKTKTKVPVSLKEYGTYLHKLKAERSVLLLKQDTVHKELKSNKERIAEIEKKIKSAASKGLSVSDHAILRYLERVEQIPPAEVAARILTPKLKEMVATLGDGLYPVDHFQVRVVNNTVVTVFLHNQ